MPLVELASNKLRLSTDTNQDGGRGAFERGNSCLGWWNREIQARPASDTVQFHICQIISVRMLSSVHIDLFSRRGCISHVLVGGDRDRTGRQRAEPGS